MSRISQVSTKKAAPMPHLLLSLCNDKSLVDTWSREDGDVVGRWGWERRCVCQYVRVELDWFLKAVIMYGYDLCAVYT